MPDNGNTAALVGAVSLVLLSGLFSGLNLGLMSFTDDDLGLVIEGSSDQAEVANAKAIRPVRAQGNLLLCTLLLGNTLVNAVIAILLSDLTSGLVGTLVTTALILVFGEIVPQSVCSRHALAVGAAVLPIVKAFVFVCWPIAYPISVLLDWLLGREISGVFSRQGLLALIKLNVESDAHAAESGLTRADMKVLSGALTYQDRTVEHVMTPLEDCFTLPLESELDRETILAILQTGHTRIPVFDGAKGRIVALLFCKDLLGIGFERSLPLKAVLDSFNAWERVHFVSRQTKLDQALAQCQRDRVHMLLVVPPANTGSGDGGPAAGTGATAATASASARRDVEGVVTLEDFLEEILQEHIVDESDVVIRAKHFTGGPSPAGSPSKTGGPSPAGSPSKTGGPSPAGSPSKTRGLARVKTRKAMPPTVPLQRLNSRAYDTTALLASLGKGKGAGSKMMMEAGGGKSSTEMM